MYEFFLWPLTLINTLLFVAGVCAWAVWASRQRDAHTEIVENLTGKKPTAWLKHVERCNCVRCAASSLAILWSLHLIPVQVRLIAARRAIAPIYAFARQHGGTATIRSGPKDTTMSIYLAAADKS